MSNSPDPIKKLEGAMPYKMKEKKNIKTLFFKIHNLNNLK